MLTTIFRRFYYKLSSANSKALVLTIIFALSLLAPTLTFNFAQPVSMPKSPPRTGTTVSWAEEDNSTVDTSSWKNTMWQFGPYPTYQILLKDGTPVTDVNFIPVDEQFTVVINVQNGIFSENETLGAAGLNWNTNILNSTNPQQTLGSAHARMTYVNCLVGSNVKSLPPNWRNGTFELWSETYNSTEQAIKASSVKVGDSKLTPEQGPMPFPSIPNSFYIFNSTASHVDVVSNGWTIYIVGAFNASTTPKGPYNVNLEVFDSYHEYISFGYAASSLSSSPWRMVAVGKPGLAFAGYSEYWTFEKYDMKNQTVYSVARGAPFTMSVNVTSTSLSNVTLSLPLADNIQTYVNVTGWHSETMVEAGGWQFNSSAGTYFWNASAQVQRIKQVYGPYQQQQWTWLPHRHTINVWNSYWNSTTGKQEPINYNMTIMNEQLYLVYSVTSGFSVKQGYNYFGYDPSLGYSREFQVLEPLNASDVSTQFFSLNTSLCRAYTVGSTQVIDFVGSFNKNASSGQSQYQLSQPKVTRIDGSQIYADWNHVDFNSFQIAVDQMVAITKVLDSSGREIKLNMLMTDVNRSFTIQSILQGGEKFYDDIEAVGLNLYSSQSSWAPDASYWSNVNIKLAYNRIDGTITSATYNNTVKSAYIYAPHMSWKQVNVTGFHDQYNMSTGIWEWVDGSYTEMSYVNVTEWHWATFTLNQTALVHDESTIWIDTSQKYLPQEDPAFKVPDYATLSSSGTNISLSNGLVIANLNVSFNSNAPQTNYWWSIFFGNRTFGPDYCQGWGEHTISEWTNQPIRSVNSNATGSMKWYMETPSQPYFSVINGTKYKVDETPYIVVNGKNYYVSTQTTYDPYSGTENTKILLSDPWNPVTKSNLMYYQLLNGTKVYVDQGYMAVIRNIKLNCTDAYTLDAAGLRIPLSNQTVFITYMPYAQPDYSRSYWDQALMRQVQPQFYEKIDGTRVYRDQPFELSQWNQTTGTNDLKVKAYSENDTSLLVSSAGSGVYLNQSILVRLRAEGSIWQYSPSSGGYYLVMVNGTRIMCPDPWSKDDQHRIVNLQGKNFTISWPQQLYNATYECRIILVKQEFVHNFYYTTWGGDKSEMPYPGALANSWWNLETFKSNGGSLPTGKSITIDNAKYLILQSGAISYIVYGGYTQPVEPPKKDVTAYYSLIGPRLETFWNITQGGWSLQYGTWGMSMGQMESVSGRVETTTGYDSNMGQWLNYNRYGMDSENSTLYLINATDGSRIDIYQGRYLTVWSVIIGKESYYTLNNFCQSDSVRDNATGQMVWRNYITTLNGRKIYYDPASTQANWIKEYHVELPGTNYTRLIPYVWDNQSFLDKTYMYDIRVVNNTGLYFADGVQVPENSTLRVWGSQFGPGIQVYYNGGTLGGVRWPSFLETDGGVKIFDNITQRQFGWNGSGWSSSCPFETIINVTASARVGGSYIRLTTDDSQKQTFLDIAGNWQPQGQGCYVMLKNGTRFDFTYGSNFLSGINMYVDRSIVLDGRLYWSDGFQGEYYNVTEGGVVHKLYDQNYLVASMYSVPVPQFDDITKVLWMNATSSNVLVDISGYYLINASDQQRLDLSSVSSWWASCNLTDQIRSCLFKSTPWTIQGAYPRYNVTIGGVGYYVLDPSPTTVQWHQGGWDWENGRYPNVFTFNGVTYPLNFNDGMYRWRNYHLIIVNGFEYELQDENAWTPVYSVPTLGMITTARENIYLTHAVWGQAYTWQLSKLPVTTITSVNTIILGTPKMGMWGINSYSVISGTGAVDLDGDQSTKRDQYFVKQMSAGTDSMNTTVKRMYVDLMWDPNATVLGDEMHVNAWMGVINHKWTYTWNNNYVWYYATNMSIVSGETMKAIQNKLIDNVTGQPRPGYWSIAYMAQNTTWRDLQAKADGMGMNWIKANTQEWQWLSFGTSQDYGTNWNANGTVQYAQMSLRNEFAGLLLWNDTKKSGVMLPTEITNYFMPKSVGSVSFKTPGEAYNVTSRSGRLNLTLTDIVSFGVTFNDVNGTLFPYIANNPNSMWSWWDGNVKGQDYMVPNLNCKPVSAGMDKMQFTVHFNASISVAQGVKDNTAQMKTDQYYGQWSIDPTVIDGRTKTSESNVTTYLRGLETLQDRSLAASWYVTASSSAQWGINDGNGRKVSSTGNVTESSVFDVASSSAKFATLKMGGTYDWSKPIATNDTIRTMNVSSFTTPMGTFRASYMSNSGMSSAGFGVTESMYFLTIGFSKWSGYPILNDPETTAYMSKLGLILGPKVSEPTDPSGTVAGLPIPMVAGVVGVALAATGASVFAIRRKSKAAPLSI
ncbi:MAG: hypothetical protein QG670_1128 [Thermoproteota archaeon]|nr:hypothetical protein [Thermoproteota archaeon]